MSTAMTEVNSTDLLFKSAKEIDTIIEKEAAQDIIYYRLTAIIEQEDSSNAPILLEETTYLDTQSMSMMYEPPYIPDDDVANNYSTVWVFESSVSSPADYVVRNYATPGATMQFIYNPSKKWWDITFGKYSTNDISISDGAKEKALSTKVDGNTVYLVNISAIVGGATDDRKVIVGATEDMVSTGGVNMWKTKSVEVTEEFPIPPPQQCLPLIPLIGGTHMRTQPDGNNAAKKYFCSLI